MHLDNRYMTVAWDSFLSIAGGDVASAKRNGICDAGALCAALMDGTIMKVKGVGRKNYTQMCECLGLRETLPVFRNGRLVKSPLDLSREIADMC